jgi:membrane protease YdiL (CAAX protease family)
LTTLTASASTSAWTRAAWLAAGLGAAALARSAFNGTGAAGAFLSGSIFGLTLLLLALAGGWRPATPRAGSLAVGVVGGLVLVTVPLLVGPASRAVIGMGAEPYLAWVAVTALVATAEEAMLRGAILSALDEAGGSILAVIGSSAAFALMHVPLYGRGVVPVDLAAGVLLAGLRYLTGGTAAPTIAHLLADLATWWL